MPTMQVNGRTGMSGIAATDHHAVTADGVTLALARYVGTVKHNVPVLMTHGLFSNRQVCAPLAQYLAREGFDCWVLELRGHGASEKPATRADPEAWGAYDVPTALETIRATPTEVEEARMMAFGRSAYDEITSGLERLERYRDGR